MANKRCLIGTSLSDKRMFFNWLHNTAAPRSQGNISDGGWPKNGVSINTATAVYPPLDMVGKQIVFGWQGEAAGFTFFTNGLGAEVVTGGAFVTSLRPADSGSVSNLAMSGTNGRVVFTVASQALPPDPTQITLSFSATSGYAWNNFKGLYLCYLDEEADYLAAMAGDDPAAIFRPEYVDAFIELGLTDFRPMGWANPNDNNNETSWDYRPDWKNDFNVVRDTTGWYEDLWVGTISGDGDYTCSAPSYWPGLVHGAQVQGQLASNNTKKFPTLTVGSEDTVRVAAIYGNTAIVSVAGTIAIGNELEITFHSPSLPGGEHTVSFTATAATAANVATGLVAAITADATLQAAHIWTDYSANSTSFRVVWSYDITFVSDIVTNVVSGSGTMDAYMGSLTQTLPGALTIDDNQNPNDDYTFTYDAYLNCFQPSASGVTNRMPLEVQIAFSNRLGTNFWATLPTFATADYIANAGALMAAEVAPGKEIDIECSNEIWNGGAGFQQTTYGRCLGISFGLSFGSAHDISTGYALLTSKMFDALDAVPALVSRGYNGVLACQAAGGAGSNIRDYRFGGAALNNGQLTPTGDARYARLIGQEYHTSPNRPSDRGNVISYATYYLGPQSRAYLPSGNLLLCGPEGSSISGLLAAADAYDSGDPAQMQAAIEWLDWDITKGLDFGASKNAPRLSVTSMTFATPGVVTTNVAHGLSVGSACAFIAGGTNGFPSSGTIPSNVTAGRNYYVTAVPTGTTFRMSETPGGSDLAFASAATGTNYLGTLFSQSVDGMAIAYYQPFETLLASYDSHRASLGKPPMELRCYEGCLELWRPTISTTSDGTDISGYTGIGGKLDRLYKAYKRSVELRRTSRRQLEMFLSYSHSTVAAQLLMFGDNLWALHADQVGSEKWQHYYGQKRFANRTKTVDVE